MSFQAVPLTTGCGRKSTPTCLEILSVGVHRSRLAASIPSGDTDYSCDVRSAIERLAHSWRNIPITLIDGCFVRQLRQ
jgi:hypothetical protein